MRNPEATKELIISKSADLFNTQGYKATSLSDITKATGYTKGAIYRHFENKEDFNNLMLAKHDYSFEHAAKMFSYSYLRIESLEELESSLVKAFSTEGNTLLEVICPEDAGVDTLKKVTAAIHQELE